MAMHSRRVRIPGVLALLFSGAVVSLGGEVPRSRAEADQMLRKIVAVNDHGERARPAARRTAFTEREVNAYLAIHARQDIPAGVIDPVVTIGENGRVSGRAIVDLDQVRQAARASGGSIGMLALLSGRVPIEAHGVLRSANGVAQLQLESAFVSGVPVPKPLLQEVVSYYSRSPELPAGIDLEAPFELPARIREIRTQKGQALIIQ
jgi:hypothetical protein